MRAACEKLDCGKPAVAQARFGEVAVARACSDHAHELDRVYQSVALGLRNASWSRNP